MRRYSLSTHERIKNSNEITTLIREGQAFFSSPYKVYYSWQPFAAETRVRVAFAVPKKKFGKAVIRNKLKRRGREAFRLQKHILDELLTEKGEQLNILFMYQRTQVHESKEIHKAVKEILFKIVETHA